MSGIAFKAQVRSVPDAGACMVRRPCDTADRRVWLTRATLTAQVDEWMLVLDSGGMWWGISLFGAAEDPPPPPMPDPEDPPPPPEPEGPATMEVPASWIGARGWTPHTGTPGEQAGFLRGTSSGRIGNAQPWSAAVPNPNPSIRWEAMACFPGIEGIAVQSMRMSWMMGTYSTEPVAGAMVTLWSLPTAQPADTTGNHPAGLVQLAEVSVGTIKPGQWIDFDLPSAWQAQFATGSANGLGFRLPNSVPVDYFFSRAATPSSLQVIYTV